MHRQKHPCYVETCSAKVIMRRRICSCRLIEQTVSNITRSRHYSFIYVVIVRPAKISKDTIVVNQTVNQEMVLVDLLRTITSGACAEVCCVVQGPVIPTAHFNGHSTRVRVVKVIEQCLEVRDAAASAYIIEKCIGGDHSLG